MINIAKLKADVIQIANENPNSVYERCSSLDCEEKYSYFIGGSNTPNGCLIGLAIQKQSQEVIDIVKAIDSRIPNTGIGVILQVAFNVTAEDTLWFVNVQYLQDQSRNWIDCINEKNHYYTINSLHHTTISSHRTQEILQILSEIKNENENRA